AAAHEQYARPPQLADAPPELPRRQPAQIICLACTEHSQPHRDHRRLSAQLRLTEHVAATFFFSSRSRHTRWPRDWSSDVCSSDLAELEPEPALQLRVEQIVGKRDDRLRGLRLLGPHDRRAATFQRQDRKRPGGQKMLARSEERRVGKEGRWRWARRE